MKDKVKVSVVQMSSGQAVYDAEKKDVNMKRILDYIENYGPSCDIIIFPELAIPGYIPLRGYVPKHIAEYKGTYWQVSEDISNSHSLKRIEEVAHQAGCLCIVGFSERSRVKYEIFNSAALIEPGKEPRVSRKVHLPTEENHFFIPGSSIEVFDTSIGKVGIVICYDFMFPEVTRILALSGAEIVVIIANVVDLANFKLMSQAVPVARAIENQLHVIFCNACSKLKAGKDKEVNLFGESKIINSLGNIVAEAPSDEESVITAVITEEELKTGTAFLSVFRDRRASVYGPLLEPLG